MGAARGAEAIRVAVELQPAAHERRVHAVLERHVFGGYREQLYAVADVCAGRG